jgi:hypothetical protein
VQALQSGYLPEQQHSWKMQLCSRGQCLPYPATELESALCRADGFGKQVMNKGIIGKAAIKRRLFWIKEIVSISGKFNDDFERIASELADEIKKNGAQALLDHLRLAGSIPESYAHDSSEEKLYSKYTDALLANSFKKIGLQSVILSERGDSADVEAVVEDFSLVADAKAFRLSRTAKNQKDFKVQAMDGWKRGKPFAMVVCPLHQLPSRTSQIYEQAVARNVCIFSYSHLSVLVCLAELVSQQSSTHLLHEILKSIRAMPPAKDAIQYWTAINRTMLGFHKFIPTLWDAEKRAMLESLRISKEHALIFLSAERARMMSLSRNEAIQQLLKINKIESRISIVNSVGENNLMGLS